MKKAAKKLKTKLSGKKGFTLVEVLFSVMILMLSTSIMIQCFALGMGHIVRETRASEAQLLCSSLTSSLQNELTYARDLKVTDGKLDTYFSSSRGMGAGCSIVIDNGEVKITNATTEYPLVSSANYKAANRVGVSSGNEYFLQASFKDNAITWDSTNGVFVVTLWVDDALHPVGADAARDKALAYSKFSVKPLAGVKMAESGG